MFTVKRNLLVFSVFALFISVAIAGQHSPLGTVVESIELDRYELKSRIDLAEIEDDLSGLTFNPLTKSLFAVTNAPEQVVEISLEGKVKRIIPLIGFDDTEGITHIHGNQFAVVEERKRHVVFISIDQATSQIERSSCETYALPFNGEKNKGLEGIAWSERSGLLIAKEDEPEQLYHFERNPNVEKEVNLLLKRSEERQSLEDVAGLHSLKNGNTLFLSEASRMLLELSPNGEILSKKSFGGLRFDPFGVFQYIRQPEGVTLSDDGRLFVVSEPNQLIIFHKPNS